MLVKKVISGKARHAAGAPAASPGGANTFIPSLSEEDKHHYDADGFTTIKDVPLFDEHDGHQEGLDIDFDEDLLRKIVAQCNARIKDTGDWVPVTAGHTSDDPQAPEPEVLGYAVNFSLGEIGNENPRACILGDLKIHKDKMGKVKQLARRSIELWPDLCIDPVVLEKAKEPAIDSVALLGSERPARDLGLLFQKKNSGRCRYQYEIKHSKEGNINPEDIKTILEAIASTPEFQFIKDLMKEKQAQMEMGEEEKEQYSDDPLKDEEPEKLGKKCMAEEEKDPDEEELSPAKLRMQRDQEKRKYARMESQYAALAKEVEGLKRAERVSARKAQLLQLEAEGLQFDHADELEYVSDLEPARYAKHLAKIKKNYKRAPVNVNIRPAAVPAEGGLPRGAASSPQEVFHAAATKAAEKYGRKV